MPDCFVKNNTTPEELGMSENVRAVPKPDRIAALENAKERFDLQKENAIRQGNANKANEEYILGHSRGAGKGMEALLVKDLRNTGENISIETRHLSILGRVHGALFDFLEKYRWKKVGFSQDRQGMKNIMLELHGTKTGDADAQVIAKQLEGQFEYLRERFNKAGGDIKSLEDWGLTQHHDARKVGSVSREQWLNDIMPGLDTRRMAKQFGDETLSDADVRQIVESMYDTIRTDGISKIVPGKFPPGVRRALAHKHSERRWLHFKDGESWIRYQENYGRPDLFQAVNTHMEIMTKDIASMEVLGPNPDAGLAYLTDVATLSTAAGKKPTRKIADHALDLYSTLMGRNRSEPSKVSDALSSTRNWLVSARLGSAMLSAIGDYAFQSMTAMYNNISVMGTMTRYLKNLNVADAGDRKLAARLNLVAEYAINDMVAANRFSEVVGSGVAAKLSNITMRASGLKAHTDAARRAFQLEYMGMLADEAHKTFGQLHRNTQRAFKAKGITSDDWNVMRKSKKYRQGGSSFMDPRAIDDVEIQTKLTGLVMDETDYAVPTPDTRVRTVTTWGTKQGTFAGEVARTTMQFKTFPISVLLMHGSRALWGNQGMDKLTYGASLIGIATMLGAVAMAAKDVSRGKDPKDMDSKKFWANAIAQGGGLGIIGDIIFQDHNKYGGAAFALGGPAGDVLAASTKLIFGTAQDLFTGEDITAGEQAARLGQGLVPGQSLWYARLALERYVFDNVKKLADPQFKKKQRRRERKMKKEFGQEYYWKPGESAPSRAPELPKPPSTDVSDYVPEF